jgi:hypothetical protein
MTPSGIEVRYFGADCRDCGCEFEAPLLSDFSYGEFILHGRGVAAHLNSIAEPAWDDIDSRLAAAGLLSANPPRDEIDRMQAVIAAAADRVGGQRLHIRRVCPHCQSFNVRYGVHDPRQFHPVPRATYEGYLGLADGARNELLARLWIEVAAELESR